MESKDLKIELSTAEVGEHIHSITIIDDRFCCEICSLIIWDPVSCSECDQLYCEKCIDDWIKKSKDCPHCRKIFTKTNLNRYVKNMLYEVKLTCPSDECKKEIKYGDMITHIQKECPHIEVSCPHNCVMKAKRSDIGDHLEYCDMVQRE